MTDPAPDAVRSGAADTGVVADADGERPVFGRPSPAAGTEPVLRPEGHGGAASWRAEGASTEWCTLRAASVTGVRHRLAGRGSDDAFAWAHDGDRLAVAIADGVGAVADSAAAAHRVVTTAVGAALAGLPAPDARLGAGESETALRAAVDAANRAAEGGGATTLVVALVLPAAGGGLDVSLARVGDSTALVVKEGGAGDEIFAAPDTERADTATAALPAGSPVVETATVSLWDGAVLALVTDGVGDPWRDGPSTVAPALAAALLGRPSPPELLRVADFSRRGCHDDRTLVCLWGRPAPAV